MTAINTYSIKLVFAAGWLTNRIMANRQIITPKTFCMGGVISLCASYRLTWDNLWITTDCLTGGHMRSWVIVCATVVWDEDWIA